MSLGSQEVNNDPLDFGGSAPKSIGDRSDHQGIVYPCSFCSTSFRKKSDWSRHEVSVHLRLDQWVCEEQEPTLWLIGVPRPRCNYCGVDSPDKEHLLSHESQSCAERQINERTFSRKDHLLQHLMKFHKYRVWDGQNLRIQRTRRREVRSRCGFCSEWFTTWSERVEHLTSHFKQGTEISQWSGDWGFDEEILRQLKKATLPQDRTHVAGIEACGIQLSNQFDVVAS